MKKKINLLVMFIITSLVLMGFGVNTVTLLRKSKVIDLQKAIEFARPGGDEGEKPDTTATDNLLTNNDKESTEKEVVQRIPTNVKIIVSGKTIKINGAILNDASLVEGKLREIFRKETTYDLIDDYAEAHVYKDVIKVLENLNTEIGLKYSIDE